MTIWIVLSRLPLELDTEWTDETEDNVRLLEQQQLNEFPIKASNIHQEAAQDPVLSKVYNFTIQGWPNSIKSFNLSTFNDYTYC